MTEPVMLTKAQILNILQTPTETFPHDIILLARLALKGLDMEEKQAAFDAMLAALKTIAKAPLYESPLDPDHAVGLIARHNHAVRLASNTVYAIEEKTRAAIALADPTTHTERSA